MSERFILEEKLMRLIWHHCSKLNCSLNEKQSQIQRFKLFIVVCTYVYRITEKTEMEKYFQLVWTKVTLSQKVWNTYNVISDDEAKRKVDKAVVISFMSLQPTHLTSNVCTIILSISLETFKYRIKFDLSCAITNCYRLKVKHILFVVVMYSPKQSANNLHFIYKTQRTNVNIILIYVQVSFSRVQMQSM